MPVRCKLKEVMEKQNVTQSMLSQVTGIGQSRISLWCRNENMSIQFHNIDKLMFSLELTSIDELLEYTEDEEYGG